MSRCGSNCHLRHVIILCVSDRKLYVSMQFTFLFKEEITQVYDRLADSLKLFNEKHVYEMALNLTGKNEYKLIANIHDINSSKHDPTTNYDNYDKTTLNFDPKEHIFYNDFEDIDAIFRIWNPEVGESKKRITGNYQLIKLGRLRYIYIDGIWYEEGGKAANGERDLSTDYVKIDH
jgi:hypothetical protein